MTTSGFHISFPWNDRFHDADYGNDRLMAKRLYVQQQAFVLLH
jgi:hypothetical protein